MSLIDIENTYFFSSSAALGAKNIRDDGSSFQIRLDKPIFVPPTAVDCTIECRSANIWFICPNISEKYNNNHVYYSTTETEDGTLTITDANNRIRSTLDNGKTADIEFPTGVFTYSALAVNINQVLKTYYDSLYEVPISGGITVIGQTPMFGRLYVSYNVDIARFVWDISVGSLSEINHGVLGMPPNSRGNFNTSPVNKKYFDVTIPEGLYSVDDINQTVQRLSGMIVYEGSRLSPKTLKISGNGSTQRVIVTLASGFQLEQSSILPNNIAGLTLGFTNPNRIISYSHENDYFEADSIAGLTRINSFYLHGDLVLEGLTVNNGFDNVLTEIQITNPPGSLIVYRPFKPYKLNGCHLKYGSKQELTFYLTDENNRPVDTYGESFSFSIVVKYKVMTNVTGMVGATPNARANVL